MTGSFVVGETSTIPVICGPTGSGKTAAALELAGRYPVEIVSADSRQIIRHLDIGTAKPGAEERQRARFHLIDLIEPGERYTAYRFIDDANRVIGDVLRRGSIPLVVGGTGLYLRALMEGVVEIEGEDLSLRDRLENEWEVEGPEKMHRRLESIDPLEAARTHANNKVRVLRALEIFYLTGKSKSELAATGAYNKSGYGFECFCIVPDRQTLYRVIDERVDLMFRQGLVEELKGLLDRGLGPAVATANVIGYAELQDHLDGKISLPEAAARIKQNSRRYAKRQLTWFRHQIKAQHCSDSLDVAKKVGSFLGNWPGKSVNKT